MHESSGPRARSFSFSPNPLPFRRTLPGQRMRVAFLGLGAIGAPMAAHLARDQELTVWNRTPERARDFAARHRARVAATPRDAVTGADAILTCLPTSADVAQLLDGADGILAG